MATEQEARATGFGWRWVGWASWPVAGDVLAIAAATLLIDVVSAWWGSPAWSLGGVQLSPALPLMVLLVAVVGARRAGNLRRVLAAWWEFLFIGAAVTLAWISAYPQSVAERNEIAGVVIAVAGEEVVYRLAAVLVIGALCARLVGRNWRDTADWGTGPAIVAIVGAAGVFSLLPGHIDQMGGAADALPFLSLGVLLGYVVLRSGTLVPGFLVHLVIDLAALAYFADALPGTIRMFIDVGSLLALVLGLMLAGRRLGLRRRVPAVIDLRNAQPEPVEVAG